jgi:hypothetical protein
VSLRSDLKPALTGTWLILSAALATAAIAPFLIPAEVLYGVFPECEAKRRGASCALCGMTTAYVFIARGDLAAAYDSNGGSIALWSASVLNFIAATAYSLMALVRRRRYSGGHRTCNSLP